MGMSGKGQAFGFEIPQNGIQRGSFLMVFLTFFKDIFFMSLQRTLDGNEWEKASIRISRCLACFQFPDELGGSGSCHL